MNSRAQTAFRPLKPERVAYWYFRLNGFLQIENFVIHPGGRGGQRTDADLLAVRFPNRRELLFDHPVPMHDDVVNLQSPLDRVDVVIAEIKTNEKCRLNGPWTEKDKQNVDRVLAAIGCLEEEQIATAASEIYRNGSFRTESLQVRLVAVGRDANAELAERYKQVTQVTWTQILKFIWERFRIYRNQKTDIEQWDAVGRQLKSMADGSPNPTSFVRTAASSMGINAAGPVQKLGAIK